MAYYKKRKGKKRRAGDSPEQVRVILPNKGKGEIFGFVERKTGAYRMYVKCSDGKVRLCRIPGAMRRRIWIRENDLVIVRPWELEGDSRGDIIHLYRRGEQSNLRTKGYLKAFETKI